MFVLNPDSADLRFPPVELASPEGLLAIGGDLRSERLLEAYRHGIFPWYNDGQPILWWSPDPRAVLFPARLHVSHSLHKTIRRGRYRVTLDERFADVMRACAAPRAKNPVGGTWITAQMLEAYTRLHQQGYAHSIETWDGDSLVGGLYGVAIGGAFFGESMFSRATDASKVAFAYGVRQMQRWGFSLIDCQLSTPHLTSLGAESVRRRDYLNYLAAALRAPQHATQWRFDADLVLEC